MASGAGPDGRSTGEDPVEFDCSAGCQVTDQQLPYYFRRRDSE